MRTSAVARAAGCCLFALLLPAGGCAFDLPTPAPAAVPAPARRPLVPQPRLTLTPATLELAPGERVMLLARPSGGEAILFSVDWSIREGTSGGQLFPETGRREDGSYAAVYQAPQLGSGPFHVRATLHEFPAVGAEASVQLRGNP